MIYSLSFNNRLFLFALQIKTILKYNWEKPRFIKASQKQIRIVLQRQIHKPKEHR